MPVSHYMLADPHIDPRIQRLWSTGHFANPSMHEANNVTEADLPTLAIDDHVVREAAQSYQTYFVEILDSLTQQIHGRDPVLDGEIGPATSKLLEMPRCGVPEFGNRAEANWPTDCRNEITVSYDFDSINATVASAAWPQALKAWVDRIELMFDLKTQFSQSTRIWATDGPLPGSTLAWSMLATSSCNARLEQRYDTTINWSVTYLSSTIVHEVGHALGLNHINNRNAIMYPSISNITVPGEPDVAAMVQLGYKRRTTPVPPPPGPTPGGLWTGELKSVEGQRITLVGVPS